MTTTNAMEGEDIGGLTRRHFIGLAIGTGVGVAGIATVLALLSGKEPSIPQQPAVATQSEEKSERYKTLANKYAEEVETGRRYVAKKQNVSPNQVEAVVLDTLRAGHGPKKPGAIEIGGGYVKNLGEDILPSDQSALFAAYAHPKGYMSVAITNEGNVYEYLASNFCDDTMRQANRMVRNRIIEKNEVPNREFALSSAKKLTPKECLSNGLEGDCTAFALYAFDGWHDGDRGPNAFNFYIADTGNGRVFKIQDFVFLNNPYCK